MPKRRALPVGHCGAIWYLVLDHLAAADLCCQEGPLATVPNDAGEGKARGEPSCQGSKEPSIMGFLTSRSHAENCFKQEMQTNENIVNWA
jgi:hypothetical protein